MGTEREYTPLNTTEPETPHSKSERNEHVDDDKSVDPLTPAPRAASRWKSIYHFGWVWECLCWILIAGALLALVMIIAVAQDQPMEDWRHNHSNISINAIVAVLSALLKGSSMYIVAEVIGQTKWQWFGKANRLKDFGRIDSASRGPWGSLKLLFRMRAPILALLGAFITVVALAVDPFTQNIIAARNCQRLSSNRTASIPVAQTYQTRQGSMPRNQYPKPGDFTLWGIDRYSLDAPMKAAIYSGLYGSSTTVINASTISPNCPGVNCTFPQYNTLGFCHQCADISSFITKSCNPDPPTQDKIFHPPCTWSLPNGQNLQSYAEAQDYHNLANQTERDIFINFAIANSTTSTIVLPSLPGIVTNVSFMANSTKDPRCTIDSGNNCGNYMGVPTMEFETIAVECTLFACARTYTASVIDGVVVEKEVKRTMGQENWLRDHGEFYEGLIPEELVITPDENCTSCTYKVPPQLTMGLGNFFWSFWNGSMSGRHYSDVVSNNDIMDVIYASGITNFTHIDRIVKGVADSMTAAVRLTGDIRTPSYRAGRGNITGQVIVTETCIDVRWGWIALPAGVAFLTLLLLIATIIRDRIMREHSAWKTSALPVLFHGLDATELMSKDQLLTTTDMEKQASALWVRLTDEKSGTLRLETCRKNGVIDDEAS